MEETCFMGFSAKAFEQGKPETALPETQLLYINKTDKGQIKIQLRIGN